MRSTLFIIILLIGISHGFLGSINQVLSQVGNSAHSATNQIGQILGHSWNNITAHMENVIGKLVNSINELRVAAEVLWERLFSPAFEMMLKGGQVIVNEQLNTMRYVINNPITTRGNLLSEKYTQLIARLKSNVHDLYENLFTMQRDSLLALEKGDYHFEERIRAFYGKIQIIRKQIHEWSEEIKNELTTYEYSIQGDWLNTLNQYKQNIDVSVKTLVKMFEQLTESLIKNFLKVVLTMVPNASNRIEKMKEQGLLSFFP
ncbi:unnamed protein product [Rotaria socialis]|uniref:Uncharacterized protein n=1 Tax=Rotaria socialis TaxID=392032 RepID=A0A817R8N7_9BILA|nr:unnamed protein product [Rotaria socialis]CAF3332343.1 unnamed protein product [Rotaria socialis]CAF3396895.1 unnamed protein product [Rotaria socialis]CAF3551927.1 unnamed protein product [Rotaria socialis]CAF3769851.1 unnamed protein product [Rotaria socialis]